MTASLDQHDAPGMATIALARHYLSGEYRAKLRLTIAALPPDVLWWRANDQSNSIGNLLLHLAGNIRQWIVSGVGGAPDERHRAAEFAARGGESARQLLAHLETAIDDVDRVLASLTSADLHQPRHIQGRDITVLDAVFHVVEHFSYHVGQIVLVAKMHAPGALQFYEDAGGLARPLWKA